MADALPLRAHTVTPNGEDLFETIDRIVHHNDEPSSSLGQYSQWHVMKLAAEKGVTVVLNGQGGDELMAGYWRYLPTYTRELIRSGRWRRAALEINGDTKLHGSSLSQSIKQVFYPLMPGYLRKSYARTLSTKVQSSEFPKCQMNGYVQYMQLLDIDFWSALRTILILERVRSSARPLGYSTGYL